MSWFDRIRSATSRLATNTLSGARRLASNIRESVQRRITDFGNWLTDRVGPEQTSQVLNEIVEHVKQIILLDNHSKLERVIPL